jgi:hypothetical protein
MHVDNKLRLRSYEENRLLNLNAILDDNRSILADESRRKFAASDAMGETHLYIRCGDTRSGIRRYYGDNFSYREIPSIAMGIAVNKVKNIANTPSTKSVVVFGHCDGSTVSEGKSPGGCGGLHAKELLNKGITDGIPMEIVEGLKKYVVSEDVIAQTLNKAQHFSEQLHLSNPSGRTIDVAAILGFHDTLETKSLGFFRNGEYISGVIPFFDKTQICSKKAGRVVNYDGNKVPEMIGETPEVFKHLIDANNAIVEKLHKDPNVLRKFSAIQKDQNPHTILFSSVLMPPHVPLPTTFGNVMENEFFNGFIPRNYEDGGFKYKPELIIPILVQAYYGLYNAIKNHGQDGKSFRDTCNFWINTSSMTASKNILSFLRKQDIVKDFINVKKNHGGVQLIASKMSDGFVRDIDVIRN